VALLHGTGSCCERNRVDYLDGLRVVSVGGLSPSGSLFRIESQLGLRFEAEVILFT
jgi:hypothetical protein